MEIKITYHESSNPLKEGWKVQINDRYAYLTPGEVLEFMAALMFSKNEAEERLSWLKTEEEHNYIDSLYQNYIQQLKSKKD
ncbi:MAG: hypothetical protein NZZ41_02675 [Candidatus Dojkabacteria bacterium]|nr:hypothetical protein [Candidatus Dojkabacteria bacterium]